MSNQTISALFRLHNANILLVEKALYKRASNTYIEILKRNLTKNLHSELEKLDDSSFQTITIKTDE